MEESDGVVRAALARRGLPILDLTEMDIEANACRADLEAMHVSNERRQEAVRACRCLGYVDETKLHPGPRLAIKQVFRLLSATDEHCALPHRPSALGPDEKVTSP